MKTGNFFEGTSKLIDWQAAANTIKNNKTPSALAALALIIILGLGCKLVSHFRSKKPFTPPQGLPNSNTSGQSPTPPNSNTSGQSPTPPNSNPGSRSATPPNSNAGNRSATPPPATSSDANQSTVVAPTMAPRVFSQASIHLIGAVGANPEPSSTTVAAGNTRQVPQRPTLDNAPIISLFGRQATVIGYDKEGNLCHLSEEDRKNLKDLLSPGEERTRVRHRSKKKDGQNHQRTNGINQPEQPATRVSCVLDQETGQMVPLKIFEKAIAREQARRLAAQPKPTLTPEEQRKKLRQAIQEKKAQR